MQLTNVELKQIVMERLNPPAKCYGHCDQPAELKFLPDDDPLRAVHVCPSGYVSRIMTYADSVDIRDFKAFLTSAAGEKADVRDGDIRLATRYRWDLAIESQKEKVMQEAYWTQNYRRTKSDDPQRQALFLCLRCSSLFSQPVNSINSLCSNCVSKDQP